MIVSQKRINILVDAISVFGKFLTLAENQKGAHSLKCRIILETQLDDIDCLMWDVLFELGKFCRPRIYEIDSCNAT